MDYQNDPSLGMVGGKYSDGDPINNVPGTIIDAAAMNSIFDELIYLLNQAGVTPDKDDLTQVHEAVQAMIDAKPYLLLAGGAMTGGLQLVKGANVASTATIDPGADGNFFTVTGTTTITGIDTTNPRSPLILQFADALTLTNSASLAMPGGQNVLTTAGDVAVFWKIGSNWECLLYMRADGSVLSQQAQPYRTGFSTIVNGADAAHDIDFQPGAYVADDGETIELGSVLIKQIDGGFAEGNNQGGLGSGTVTTDETYHCFVIEKVDGTVDAYFDIAFDGTNIPSGFVRRAYVGSVVTDASSNILPFIQAGRRFFWNPTVQDYNASAQTAKTDLVLTVPTGIKCYATVEVEQASGITMELFIKGESHQVSVTNGTDGIFDILTDVNGTIEIETGGGSGVRTIETLGYENMALPVAPYHA